MRPGLCDRVHPVACLPAVWTAARKRAINQAISTVATDLAPRFPPVGGHPLILSPGDLGALIAAQIAKWHTIIEQADVHAD